MDHIKQVSRSCMRKLCEEHSDSFLNTYAMPLYSTQNGSKRKNGTAFSSPTPRMVMPSNLPVVAMGGGSSSTSSVSMYKQY